MRLPCSGVTTGVEFASERLSGVQFLLLVMKESQSIPESCILSFLQESKENEKPVEPEKFPSEWENSDFLHFEMQCFASSSNLKLKLF